MIDSQPLGKSLSNFLTDIQISSSFHLVFLVFHLRTFQRKRQKIKVQEYGLIKVNPLTCDYIVSSMSFAHIKDHVKFLLSFQEFPSHVLYFSILAKQKDFLLL